MRNGLGHTFSLLLNSNNVGLYVMTSLKFYDCQRHLKPFGLGGAVKPGKEKEDGLDELWINNLKGVCRAAPGFAWVC